MRAYVKFKMMAIGILSAAYLLSGCAGENTEKSRKTVAFDRTMETTNRRNIVSEEEAFLKTEMLPEEEMEDIDGYENLKIGFYMADGQNAAVQLEDLTVAMSNCGMDAKQLCGFTGMPLDETAARCYAEGCRLVILLPEGEVPDIEEIAKSYPDMQFMVCGRETYDAENIIVYDIDLDSAEDFKDMFKKELLDHGVYASEGYLNYEITYRPIFEEVITVWVEMPDGLNRTYLWGIDRGCIYFPAVENDNAPQKVREVFEKVRQVAIGD